MFWCDAICEHNFCDSIERMSMEAVPSQRRAATLVSLKDEAKALKDESKAVKDEADRLADSNKVLQRRFSTGKNSNIELDHDIALPFPITLSVQEDATKLAREKKEMQKEIDVLRQRLETAEQSSQGNERYGKGIQDNMMRIRELEEDLEEERSRNTARVSETPQFIQMRKMMQSQNSKIRDLRYFVILNTFYLTHVELMQSAIYV